MRRGEISAEDVIDAVAAQQAHRMPFVEVLVLRGKLTEKGLLTELAQERGASVITSGEFAKLKVESDVLDRLPVRQAEALCALPVRYEPRLRQLFTAVASLEPSGLERLARAAQAPEVVPMLATTFAIRAGIRRFYYRDKDAFWGLSKLAFQVAQGAEVCPNCKAPIAPNAFQCAKCGLLGKSATGKRPPLASEHSVVRALLSPEPPTLPPGTLRPKDAGQTARFTPESVAAIKSVPDLVGELDAALQALSPFEANVVSFIDGRMNVLEIAGATKISAVEVSALLKGLQSRNLVSMRLPPVMGEEPRTEPASFPGLRPGAVTQPGGPAPSTTKVPLVGQPTVLERGQGALQRAVLLERDGRVDQAIAVLEAAIEHDGSAVLLNRLALIILDQRHDPKKAMSLLKRAVELEPDNRAYEANLFAVAALAKGQPGTLGRGRRLLARLFR